MSVTDTAGMEELLRRLEDAETRAEALTKALGTAQTVWATVNIMAIQRAINRLEAHLRRHFEVNDRKGDGTIKLAATFQATTINLHEIVKLVEAELKGSPEPLSDIAVSGRLR